MPNTRYIVRSFLDFLHSIESSDFNSESVEVAKDCLKTAFGLHSSSSTDDDEEAVPLPHGLLLDLFSKWETEQLQKFTTAADDNLNAKISAEDSNLSDTVQEELKSEELLQRLYDAFLLKSSAKEDSDQAEVADQLFNEALARCHLQVESLEIADYFKSKGNQAMQSKQYAEAADLYTEAISLCKENATYFCNRAAAYTQLGKNLEAIKDCLKAIEIEPKYSKAYNRLGSVYFALGNYMEALNKGFLRALSLDPDNQSIRENVKMTRSKIKDEREANMRTLCNPSHVSYFSNGSNTLNPDYLSDYIKGLLHLSQHRTGSEDPIKDLTDVFLHQRRESDPYSSGSEDESEDLPKCNMSDVLQRAAQILAEHGDASQGRGAYKAN